jgi:hypothetical protein
LEDREEEGELGFTAGEAKAKDVFQVKGRNQIN